MEKKDLMHKIADAILHDQLVRKLVTKKNFAWYFYVYCADYVEYETAPFQYELFSLAQRTDWNLLALTAFRGSAKSTILTTAYPLWAVLGEQQKKFILILCQTKAQAKLAMMNIRSALERDSWLRKDLGPFKEESAEWGSTSLVFPRMGARITVASSEQSIRGIRHNQHRPDLIILDDVEDLASVKTKEGREKTYNWFKSEVIPAGGKNTRIIVIGNLLHEECLVRRLQDEMEKGLLDGISRSYPLIDDEGNIAWPGKYPTMDDIEKERRKIGDERIWYREYLLEILPGENQIIKPGWIRRYDVLPSKENGDYRMTLIGVDLAISQKESSDFTAVVAVRVHGYGENLKMYVLSYPINEKLLFPDQVKRISSFSVSLGGGMPVRTFIEGVGYQLAIVQQLESIGIPAESVPVHGDKSERLTLVSPLIRDGKILFPREGCEDLIRQLTGFGSEKHDDLMDALTLVALKTVGMSMPETEPEIFFV